ncbi:MAG TPA: di-heme oxidoredictase family protein [Casimicrobiaceae bacterium]|jgi:CxxC motif-containing protein (DUF1111 family)|nr:di-heme oxidoredictase family protein [Casimicrobiaceae bacterium]
MSRKFVVRGFFWPALVGLVLFNAEIAFSLDAVLAKDPGLRAGASAGNPLANLTPTQLTFFNMGKVSFVEAEAVADGLGPAMNLDNCGGCHSQPAFGGTSPSQNPQIALAKFNRVNREGNLPSFVSPDGPVRVARFVKNADGAPDGAVHALLTIAGRPDAPGCAIVQPDFAAELAKHNVIFRIPSPVFGAGLIEQIPDSAIRANLAANATQKLALGIRGRASIVVSSNKSSGGARANEIDGPIARFGWKAHNASLLVAAAEAYHDEMGITNELFQTERNESAACQFLSVGNDNIKMEGIPAIDSVRRYLNPSGHRYPLDVAALRERVIAFAARNPPGDYLANTDGQAPVDTVSSIEKFASFMRYLAPPTPSSDTPGGAESITRGRHLFGNVGCAACHTPTLRTGDATVAALRNQPVNLYSDLVLHDMGPGLADGVAQGQAAPREFRTAPLWGLGQRIYFLHDGRTRDLLIAIDAHRSGSSSNGDSSEANAVIGQFEALPQSGKQDILNFLRSL